MSIHPNVLRKQFPTKIFQNNHFKTTAFSNNKCWAKLKDDLVVTSEMRFVVYSAVCGLIWALDKLLYSEDPVCNAMTQHLGENCN